MFFLLAAADKDSKRSISHFTAIYLMTSEARLIARRNCGAGHCPEMEAAEHGFRRCNFALLSRQQATTRLLHD
jgi:hypothetical protein